jgi:hypothetical protein
MGLGKAAVGGAIGSTLGAIGLGAVGALSGAIDTVRPTRRLVPITNPQGEVVGHRRAGLPGLVKTGIWGAAAVGLAKYGVDVTTLPVLELVAGPVSDFTQSVAPAAEPWVPVAAAGAGLRGAKNVAVGTTAGALAGAGVGGVGGALIGSKV